MSLRQYIIIRSSQPENIYGRFVGEILRAEGLNGFSTIDLDLEPMPELLPDDLVVITRCFLRNAEMDQLLTGIKGGARVVSIQPSWGWAQRLGWQPLSRALNQGWIHIRDGHPGAGLPIQTHMPIAAYSPSKGLEFEVIADAVLSDWSDGGCPAVVRQRLGQGEAALFFYDLPEAVARIRFGNPEFSSLLKKNMSWPHAFDLFEEQVDDRVLHLPQADIHNQLLANVLTDISAYPLARLWYYPTLDMRAAAVFQSDDDGSKPEQFRELAEMLYRHGATGTFYLMEHTLLPDETVANMQAMGHTFAPHIVSVNVDEDLYFHFPEALVRETELFNARYGGGHSATLQSHCAPWIGYQSWVPLHIQNGYRLLFAYVCLPMNSYMCGSGRPLRFFDRDGTCQDCWQQPVTTFDDASIKEQVEQDHRPLVSDFDALLQGAVNEYHSTLAILSHPVSFATFSRSYIEACFDLLAQEGVPIFNGDEWCNFLDRRDATRISQSWENGGLSCIISKLVGTLPLMVPVPDASPTSSVTVNGNAVQGTMVRRLDQHYLAIQLQGKPDGGDILVHLYADTFVMPREDGCAVV